jgi:acyl carrier protein
MTTTNKQSQSIEERITSVLQGLKPEMKDAIKPDANLFAANVLDSFGIIEFIAALEQEFDIAIANDDLVPQNLWSVSAAAATVQKYLDTK